MVTKLRELSAATIPGPYLVRARVNIAGRRYGYSVWHTPNTDHHWRAKDWQLLRGASRCCMRPPERLKPMLFDDDDPTAAARERASIVAPAQPSLAAARKRASKVTANGSPVHSFHSLLRDLATCTLNEMSSSLNEAYSFTLVATPTPIQAQAFRLLAVNPSKL